MLSSANATDPNVGIGRYHETGLLVGRTCSQGLLRDFSRGFASDHGECEQDKTQGDKSLHNAMMADWARSFQP